MTYLAMSVVKDRSKRAKLDALQLSEDEWGRVRLFLDLLSVSLLTASN